MVDFRLYAEHNGRVGYCKRCIKHRDLSPHMVGKKGDICPMCNSFVFQEVSE